MGELRRELDRQGPDGFDVEAYKRKVQAVLPQLYGGMLGKESVPQAASNTNRRLASLSLRRTAEKSGPPLL